MTLTDRLELMLDIQDQVEEFNRDQRAEYFDAWDDGYDHLRPTRSDADLMRHLDDQAERGGRR